MTANAEKKISPESHSFLKGQRKEPHTFLGLHEDTEGQIIRLWRPGAQEIYLEVLGKVEKAKCIHKEGLFIYRPSQKIQLKDYRIYHASGLLAHDPYAFVSTLGDLDLFLFNKGCHYELYKVLGASVKEHQGVVGVQFAVWAPHAKRVSLVGDWNRWDGSALPMRSLGASGVWEIFIPGLNEWEKYKFEIETKDGSLRVKSDPFGFYHELRPQNASIVYNIDRYAWQDGDWMAQRTRDVNRPLSIYEVHLGSWKQYGKNPWGSFPGYRQLAKDLADYVKQMGFTHVELLPVMEHPLDESWGYQVSGFFSVTSRYGTPEDFQYFVDFLHQNGIGVILDWVPGHFPMDEFSLSRFDGTALYEYEDPKKGFHPHWNTAIFDYGRREVSNFLIASALFWFEKMHIDGIRVDAVASMLYLDYGRGHGEWTPNGDGSNYNYDAIEFLKHLNSIIHQRVPSALTFAEESTTFPKVTHPEGLGFDFKWNMGWMNDTLFYFSKDPIYRKHHQDKLTFSLIYAFSEKFLSVLSHDEVVHEKKSLLSKMPGPDWQKFATVRLFYSYLVCHPGKNLLFMGSELGQWEEWNCKGEISWDLLKYPMHQGLQKMIRDLNHFYLKRPALWQRDFTWEGFEWIDFADQDKSVLSFLRKGEKEILACVHNFTPEVWKNYNIRLKNVKTIREVFNSDAAEFGGSHVVNPDISHTKENFQITLAPLATMIFEVSFE